MSGRDESFDNPRQFAALVGSVRADRGRSGQATPHQPPDLDRYGEARAPVTSGQRLYRYFERLLEGTVTRPAAGRAVKPPDQSSRKSFRQRLAQQGLGPQIPAAGLRGAFAVSRSGVLDWADARLGLTTRRMSTP